ncbi:hypothetical protein ACFLZQ_07520 [Thermodesulfobacteriota bacterium]
MAGKKGRSGRKPDNATVSDRTKKAILKAARKLKKEYGIPIEEAMLKLCYDDDTQASVKASIWKSYLESLVVRETKTESKIDDQRRGPVIGLPAVRGQDPALKVVGKDD